MTVKASIIDSAGTLDGDESAPQYPYIEYPPYSRQYLSELLARLVDVSGGDPIALLSTLTEPTLYALVAAVTLLNRPDAEYLPDALRPALLSELRWRECRDMGTDAAGAARRGRLVQMVTTLTTLTAAGASPLQRHKLAGDCVFCGAPDFQVFLPAVSWHCFACHRQGALLEFAERLLSPSSLPQSEG